MPFVRRWWVDRFLANMGKGVLSVAWGWNGYNNQGSISNYRNGDQGPSTTLMWHRTASALL